MPPDRDNELESALARCWIDMKLAPAVAFAVAFLPDCAFPQDKKMEAVCGDLFGARQTAIRLMSEGWSAQQIVEDAINRPEWRNASMQDKKLLMDLLQETMMAPRAPSSEVIRDCMRRAEAAAPKPQ
jgi:hypothetical protein